MLLKIIWLGLLSISFQCIGFCFYIEKNPLCEIFTSQALYEGKKIQSFFAGDKQRFSTCGGVAWFHNDEYIATVNFQAACICTYQFNKSEQQCIPMQVIQQSEKAKLIGIENLSFSNDGTLLAISVNHSQQIILYSVNKETHQIDPEPLVIKRHSDKCVHGIRFSNDGHYLACTTVRGASVITTYVLKKSQNKVELIKVADLANAFLPYKPKSLDFTKDDSYVAVVYASNVIDVPNEIGGLIAIYPFDKNTGVIDSRPVSVYINYEEFKGGEDIKFNMDDSSLFVSVQAHDKIMVFDFAKGQIGNQTHEMNKDNRLNFPHGIDISSNGKYLAVANYGDDKFAIYAIRP